MESSEDSPICRLCLIGGDSLIYIFKQHVGQLSIPEVIRSFLRIEVSEGDGYPPYVCMCCFNKLSEIKQFREQCVQSRQTYDSLKASKASQQNCCTEEDLLESSADIKRESEEGLENDFDAEIPLDIVKTELTEEDGVFNIGSSEATSLAHSPDYQGDNHQQEVGAVGSRRSWSPMDVVQMPESAATHLCIHKAAPCQFKCAQYEMALRLWKDRVRQARRRAMESEEERERRLAQDRERTRARRAKESPEEKARRLERARIYMAEKRRRLVALVAMEQGALGSAGGSLETYAQTSN